MQLTPVLIGQGLPLEGWSPRPIGLLIAVILSTWNRPWYEVLVQIISNCETARVPFGQDTRDTRRWQWTGFTCFTSTPLMIYIFILMDYGSPKVPQVFQAKHCELLEGFPFPFKNLTAGLVEVLNMTMAGGLYLFKTKTIGFIFIIFVRFVLSSIFGDWCGAILKLRNLASRGVDGRITRVFRCLAVPPNNKTEDKTMATTFNNT